MAKKVQKVVGELCKHMIKILKGLQVMGPQKFRQKIKYIGIEFGI